MVVELLAAGVLLVTMTAEYQHAAVRSSTAAQQLVPRCATPPDAVEDAG
jgi:hypothetical protein